MSSREFDLRIRAARQNQTTIRAGYGREIIEDTMQRIGKHPIEYALAGLKFRMEAPIETVGWLIEEKTTPYPETDSTHPVST